MNSITTPERDLVQEVLERNQATFDDKERNNKNNANETQYKLPEDAQVKVQYELSQVKEEAQVQQEIKEELSAFALITRTELLIDKFKRIEKEANRLNNNREKK
jgi:hypothetical protein